MASSFKIGGPAYSLPRSCKCQDCVKPEYSHTGEYGDIYYRCQCGRTIIVTGFYTVIRHGFRLGICDECYWGEV